MKLFITNKREFEEKFTRQDYRNGVYNTPKQIHQSAFNNLFKEVSNNSIPIILYGDYKYGGIALFDFKSKKGDVYFYEYTTIAS